MRVVSSSPKSISVELTRRNLLVLLDKLDDPRSLRTLRMASDDLDLVVAVRAVENDEHYHDRIPGLVYMPTEGRYL